MSEWTSVPLGSVLRRHQPRRVEPGADDTVRFAEVRWYGEGLFVREQRHGRDVKAKCYALEPGMLVYNRLFAWKQSFAVVTDGFADVVVSNELPQFEVDRAVAVPEFVASYCASPIFAVQALGRSTGAAAVSRNRLKEADFLDLHIPLPPLEEQRAILDMLDAAGEAANASAAEADAADRARTAILAELFSRRDASWADRQVGAVGSVRRGRRFVKADYVDVGIGCMHYAQVHTDFLAAANAAPAYLPEAMRPRLRFAGPGSLIVAGTSESRDGVLKAVAWLGDEAIAVHDDAFIYEHGLEPRFAAYAFASPLFRRQVEHVLSDAKVVRVAQEALSRLMLPVPPWNKQVEIADTMAAVDSAVLALRAEAEAAQRARAALQDALLGNRTPVRC